METETDMETEADIETETDMETETGMETEINLTIHGHGHGHGQGHGQGIGEHFFAQYFIWRNCPNSAIWIASEISRRNFQWSYILVAPLIPVFLLRSSGYQGNTLCT
jgi:hypothetical protein